MDVLCNTNEFDGLEAGKIYRATMLGENSYFVDGKWYGRSNFTLLMPLCAA